MITLLDTNVLICMLNPNEQHHIWSVTEVTASKAKGPVIIADIVYCEFSIGMSSQAYADTAILKLGIERMRCSDAVLFRAGRAYKQYRSNKGTKLNVLPDFLIGAMAEVLDIPLVTANPRDVLTYFPGVNLLKP